MGRHGLGEMNENGEMLADFCATNNLVIGGTLFPHWSCHKATWVSPDHQTENQTDHVMVIQRYRSSLQDVRARRGAKIGTDHHLVVTKIKMRLSARKNQPYPRKKFNVGKEGGNDIDQLHHLLNLIWTTEEMPTEWKKGLLVKLPKHGNLSQCGKWKGITLLSIPSKVLTIVILASPCCPSPAKSSP
nr:hypothetical protein BaRGS_030771 [Batillaria attramentaria]